MDKRVKLLAIVTAVLITALGTGCNTSKQGQNDKNINASNANVISSSNDKAIKELINNYFTDLYSQSPDSYKANSETGIVPLNVKKYIAKTTMDEGNANPEIPVHLPRYVELNGLTTIKYKILNEESDKTAIQADYVGKNGDAYLYYVKVNTKAECVPNEVFDNFFKHDKKHNTYSKFGAIDPKDIDLMKVQTKYDVEVVKEDNEFKILKSKESNSKFGYKNRLLKFNNDFAERLNYLNISKNPDKELYDKEKTFIKDYFEKLKTIDSDRMKLLYSKWNSSVLDLANFMDKIGITKSMTNFGVGEEYKKNFNYSSFPLQSNMKRIKNYKSFNVVPHPAYTENKKRYIVTFDADVEKNSGILGSEASYKYDYFITLSGKDNFMKLESMKLNEFYMLNVK
ncbi:MAG: hypothetical protein N3B21_06385 [Clostridia bacterium]|nr:hypothetical protein [Clostridia bacterium]